MEPLRELNLISMIVRVFLAVFMGGILGLERERKNRPAGFRTYILVCLGAVLGAIGIYQPFSEWAGAGANVPLLGFGNVLWTGVKEAVDKDGFIGIFKGGFTASAVGISGALVLSYLASLITDPKMKK